MKLWLNGRIISEEMARIDPTDRGLLLGDGLFETMAAKNGEVLELAGHYARLCAGARLLRMTVPIGPAELKRAVADLLAENDLAVAALRLTLTRGPARRGLLPDGALTPTLLLTAGPMPQAVGPIKLITSTILRDEHSPLSTVKTLNYLPGILARLEASERGADDAILFNHAGNVAETSAAALFVLLRGRWITPLVEDGALPGICRATLLAGRRIYEHTVTASMLTAAEALCTGNALGLRPVLSLDGCRLPQRAIP